MIETQTAAFWSYAHEDNRLDTGGILNLADRLRNEYSLMSSKSLSVFIDRDGVEWGDEWRPTINGALAQTAFFIPILTPRYFERPECRREFIDFHSAAQSLGVSELILPILYAPIPDFDSSNSNELIALASRFQYVDWTQLRLEDPTSTLVKKEVHALAARLLEVGQRVEAAQVEKEIAVVEGSFEPRGALELIDEINLLLPAWSESVEGGVVGSAQFRATLKLYMPQLQKLEAGRGNPSAKFALTQRLAVQLLPLMRTKDELSKSYASNSLELDPLMTELFRMLERDPMLVELCEPINAALDAAEGPIDQWVKQQEQGAETVGPWARRRAHVSRVVRELGEVSAGSEALIREGNEIVLRWLGQRAALSALLNEASGEAEGEALCS